MIERFTTLIEHEDQWYEVVVVTTRALRVVQGPLSRRVRIESIRLVGDDRELLPQDDKQGQVIGLDPAAFERFRDYVAKDPSDVPDQLVELLKL